MWKRSRAARWFDSPTDSVLRRKKKQKNQVESQPPSCPTLVCLFVVVVVFLSTPRLFVSDKRKGHGKAVRQYFPLCSCHVAADLHDALTARLSLAPLGRWPCDGAAAGCKTCSQISPDSGPSLIYEILSPSYSMSFFVSADQEMSFSCWTVLMLNWWVLTPPSPGISSHCGTFPDSICPVIFFYWLCYPEYAYAQFPARSSLHLEHKDGMRNWSHLALISELLWICALRQ